MELNKRKEERRKGGNRKERDEQECGRESMSLFKTATPILEAQEEI